MKLKKGPCPHCSGSGLTWIATGPILRAMRTEAGLSLAALSERIGWSIPYLSDIERGNRNVTAKVIGKYIEATKLGSTKGAAS